MSECELFWVSGTLFLGGWRGEWGIILSRWVGVGVSALFDNGFAIILQSILVLLNHSKFKVLTFEMMSQE